MPQWPGNGPLPRKTGTPGIRFTAARPPRRPPRKAGIGGTEVPVVKWLVMTERKPQGMRFNSWVDQQIADAERRGVFDDLPGAGKPLNIKPTGGDYGEAWVRDYARREGVSAEEFLPTPLRLRREIERLTEIVGEFRSEAEIREVAADLNRRIVEWRRIPVGPPIHVRLVNTDDMVARWRAARATAAASPPAAQPATFAQRYTPRRLPWWRRRDRQPGRG
jgi:hypothetical protein